MELICFLGGSIVGCIITILFNARSKIQGVLEVDHDCQCCRIHLESKDVLNRKSKQVIFDINHNAKLSRDEQSL